MKNMLVAQSGGPSAAINATITGVIDAGIASDQVEHVYGALNGIKGVLNENFVKLDEVCDTKEKRERTLMAIEYTLNHIYLMDHVKPYRLPEDNSVTMAAEEIRRETP